VGFSWVSQLQCDGHLSSPSGPKAKNEWSYTPLSSTCLHGMDRDNSACNFASLHYHTVQYMGFSVLVEQTVFTHHQSSSARGSWRAAQFANTFPVAAVTTGQLLNWPELISLHHTLHWFIHMKSEMNKPTSNSPYTLTCHSDCTLT